MDFAFGKKQLMSREVAGCGLCVSSRDNVKFLFPLLFGVHVCYLYNERFMAVVCGRPTACAE
jgi:hypothetical protein